LKQQFLPDKTHKGEEGQGNLPNRRKKEEGRGPEEEGTGRGKDLISLTDNCPHSGEEGRRSIDVDVAMGNCVFGLFIVSE
jgi:hypothetical protein